MEKLSQLGKMTNLCQILFICAEGKSASAESLCEGAGCAVCCLIFLFFCVLHMSLALPGDDVFIVERKAMANEQLFKSSCSSCFLNLTLPFNSMKSLLCLMSKPLAIKFLACFKQVCSLKKLVMLVWIIGHVRALFNSSLFFWNVLACKTHPMIFIKKWKSLGMSALCCPGIVSDFHLMHWNDNQCSNLRSNRSPTWSNLARLQWKFQQQL